MPNFAALNPRDEHNRQLEAKAHPPDWVNPTPDGRYNLVVIGGGTAGLVSAIGGSGLGAKVALIERELMGGDCLNLGCVPSKAIIRSARAAAAVRDAGAFGVEVPDGVRVDFAAVMERMRRIRARIADHDSAQRLRDHGVDVFMGEGRFSGPDSVDVGGHTLRFKKAVIATGARAAAPPIPGLDRVEYLTNETVFSLTELPRRLGIIGAGPIGCELAQSFALLGSEVVLVEAEHGILPLEDRDAAAIVEKSMVRNGVKVLCCGRETKIRNESGQIRLVLESHGEGYNEPIDRLLVAVGRAPNVEGMGLEAAGVAHDRTGVQVDDYLRTTNPHIYAAGDVASRFKFTHAANFLARVVLKNALFPGSSKASGLTIPWCTYTLPELAHVGVYEGDGELDTYVQELSDVDRAILDGDENGFVKLHVKKGTDKIAGATVVARNAGDLISEITLAMTNGIGLGKIGNSIRPYPTHAEAMQQIGDQYNRTRLTPFVASLLRKWLAWTR